MKITFNKIIISSVLIMSIILSPMSISVKASTSFNEVYDQNIVDSILVDHAQEFADRMEGYLQVDSIDSLIDNHTVFFTYDSLGNRIKKIDGDNITCYTYNNNNLISESNGGGIVEYIVDEQNQTIGFIYNGNRYNYVFDENTNNVIEIKNEENKVVVKYDYDENNNVIILGENVQGNWTNMSDDVTFIGNVNPYRFAGFYFDKETGYYYYGGRYYNPLSREYYINKAGIKTHEGMNTNSLYSSVDQMAALLLADSSFGNAITTYNESWYESNDSVEISARLIYAENNVNLTDQPGIAWVLINRYNANSSTFGGQSIYNIATKKYQFSSIHPGTDGANQTKHARVPETSSSAWSKSVWLSCAISATKDRPTFATLVPKPTGIDKQCYFVGVALASVTMSTSGGSLVYNGSTIKNVCLIGISSNMTTMTYINKYKNQYYNVFFSYSTDNYF
ncbi:RHS repeat-associated core domain-containing protein [Anaerocolumna jejuensis DSM 15929]|uniref:RHS repeat-associated core domain-containing protein n=1 Tax=Anaerocolumna jejuensis DSM 15929 TaxID=1121322 RepID=A0A1M6TLU9_9FIRM|nr:hypothetical protein [Anaerocolumna jejuensis]SHK57758.1 RHS repeat-associated core domain-containing protein [Anaerocolumna jejuensis DSM 15929]